jgi:hypothetical protein
LTPASRRQDHTTSPSATWRSRQQRQLRPPHPVPNVRDDREAPLLRDGIGSMYNGFDFWKTEIFFRSGLDRAETHAVADLPDRQISYRLKA